MDMYPNASSPNKLSPEYHFFEWHLPEWTKTRIDNIDKKIFPRDHNPKLLIFFVILDIRRTLKFKLIMAHYLVDLLQESGLQGKDNDPDDRRIKECTHVLLSLSFVPVDDVQESFRFAEENMERGWRFPTRCAVLRENIRQWNSRKGTTSLSSGEVRSQHLEPLLISVG